MLKIFQVLIMSLTVSLSFAESSTELIRENVMNLRPTQVAVGMASVKLKTENLAKMTTEARINYLQKHPVPVVVGPDGGFYLIDHHHMSRALLESGHRYLFIQIVADWSQMNPTEFWGEMEKKGYTWLYDQNGNKLKPSQLPRTIINLQDDPYRSLAYFAREAGAYNKTTTPFAEFFWAAFYKKHIALSELSNWKKATAKAVQLSQSPEAAQLPGYKGAVACSKVF